jgi:hypothetical protein
MTIKHIPPKLGTEEFHCPHCRVYSLQTWGNTLTDNERIGGGYSIIKGAANAFCDHCKQYTLWVNDLMVYPDSSNVPEPNEDMNEDIKKDYLEAASILEKSPRGAAALLRLILQKLCIQLGESGNLNKDIKNLVGKGLSVKIQQSLDILRVIGDNAVHPGKIDIDDDKETAMALFDLVNLIAESMISEPKRIEIMYEKLPKETKKKIEKRDKNGN